jgi:Zn-dependent membrane protease YugP
VPVLVLAALVYAAGLVVFAVATLPVEFGASHRFLVLLVAAEVMRRYGIGGGQ